MASWLNRMLSERIGRLKMEVWVDVSPNEFYRREVGLAAVVREDEPNKGPARKCRSESVPLNEMPVVTIRVVGINNQLRVSNADRQGEQNVRSGRRRCAAGGSGETGKEDDRSRGDAASPRCSPAGAVPLLRAGGPSRS